MLSQASSKIRIKMKQIAFLFWVCLINCVLGSAIGPSTLSYGSSHYYINPQFRGNWMSAVEYCTRKDMKLVSLESEEELDAVFNWVYNRSDHASNSYRWWTSGTKLANDKDFIWHSTGQPVHAFGKWQNGQPNDYGGKQKCIQFWCYSPDAPSKYYDDTECVNELFAICEKKVDASCANEVYAVRVKTDDGKCGRKARDIQDSYPESL